MYQYIVKRLLLMIPTLFGAALLVFLLLRLWLPMLRVDFRNPVVQGVFRYTSPAVVPFRRFIPSIGKLDTATVVVSVLVQLAALLVIMTIGNGLSFLGGLPGILLPLTISAFFRLASLSVIIFIVAIIVRVVLSWIGQGSRHPLVPLVFQLTEPVLRPIRRWLPPVAGVDLSPLVALIAIQFVLLLLG